VQPIQEYKINFYIQIFRLTFVLLERNFGKYLHCFIDFKYFIDKHDYFLKK